MRVLQVGTGFAPVPPPGAHATQRIIHGQSAALMALGHDVTVLDIRDEDRPAVPYQVVEVDLPLQLNAHVAKGFLFAYAVRKELRRLLRRHTFDIVNFHNQFSAQNIPVVQRCGIATVFSLHNWVWYDTNACRSGWQRLRFLQELRAMRMADVVICQNETTSRNLGAAFNVPSDKRVVTALGGISADWLKSVEVPTGVRDQYAPNGEPVLLNVARIAPYKNQMTLVRAMRLVVAEVPQARLLLVGPVSDRNYYGMLVREIEDAGLTRNVVFTGEIPHAQLPGLCSLCSVFVCPSVWEAFGVVVAEAMAQGRATVASNIETFESMLSDGRGITVSPCDHGAVAKAINELLRDNTLREAMGQRAKDYVRVNYTWESVARKTLGVYERTRHGR